ncbi:MAG: SCO family protein [Nitrososphaerota archaeon]
MRAAELALIFSLVVSLTAFLPLFFSLRGSHEALQENAEPANFIAVGKPLPRFTLRNAHGEEIELESFRGKVVLIFFGYTNCPDYCPLALRRFSELIRLLGQRSSEVVMIFITTDPVRDSPEALSRFAGRYSDRIVALTGDWDELAKVWREYHVRVPEDDGKGGFISHSAVIYVADRNLVLREILTPEMTAESALERIMPLLS